MSIIAKVKDMYTWRENCFYHMWHVNDTMHTYAMRGLMLGWTHTLDLREHNPVRPWFRNMTEVMREEYAYALFYAKTPRSIL
jgi:hypothetical protein